MRLSRYAAPALASLLAVASLLAAAAREVRASGNDLTGQPAPEIRLTAGLNGATATTTLASLRGKVVCLKFWLTHCPICRGTLPKFQEIHDRYGKSGVYCLGVVIDKPEGVAPYLQEAGWTFPVGCDPDQASSSKYGVKHFPGDYVIGVDGVVRASDQGWPREIIEEELRKYRVLELGTVPDALRGVRDAVENNDYGAALRQGEAAAKAQGAASDVKAALTRLLEIATRRQDNRLTRAEATARAGKTDEARADLVRIVKDFRDTSLEARAKERLTALSALSDGK